MSDVDFKNCNLLIADAGGQNRKDIRQVLRHEGFRDILETDRAHEVHELVVNNDIDLIITDNALFQSDMSRSIRNIRHGMLGDNPFIVIITMAHDPSQDQITSIIDSGSDDIILKPLTAGTIVKKVRHLVTARKLFVVTSDYIGPTRRNNVRPESEEIPHYGVPNPLQAKTTGEIDEDSFQKEIEDFAAFLNIQKLERNSSHIGLLIQLLLYAYETDTAADEAVEILNNIEISCNDTKRRFSDTPYDHASELCNFLLSIVRNMAKNPLHPEPKDLKRLPELAQAIKDAFIL